MTSAETGKFEKAMGTALTVVAGVAMTAMMLHIVLDVCMKLLFNDPIDGTTEIVAAYYMVSTVFLPLAYVTFTEGHLVVQLFTGKMTGRPLDLLTSFTGMITLAYLLFVIYCTADEAVLRTRDGEAWETSVDLVAVWPSRWLLPIGLGAMAFIVLMQALRGLRVRRGTGQPTAPGV